MGNIQNFARNQSDGKLQTPDSLFYPCFGKNLSEVKSADRYTIATLMAQVPGWERTKSSRRLPMDGKQRVYVKH